MRWRDALRPAVALLAAALLAVAPLAVAKDATPTAADPVLEQRVTRLAEELRCLVCQNQSLADSHAPLAVDLKNEVREKLRGGADEREVIAFMVARYGDFVLYRPPVRATTLPLWIGPFALLAAALAGLVFYLRRRRADVAVDDAAHADDAGAAR